MPMKICGTYGSRDGHAKNGRKFRQVKLKKYISKWSVILFALGCHVASANVISAGHDHTCALDSNGAVKCWGLNNHGQLGDDTTINRASPVSAIGLYGGSTAIASGESFSCAMTEVSGVKCWGANQFGQLGDGSTTDRHIPTDVTGLSSGVRSISVGKYHACATLNDGSAQCWGANEVGALGYNYVQMPMSPTPLPVPMPMDVALSAISVNGASSITAPTGSGSYSCALTQQGKVKCWGDNYFGQLGHGGDFNWNPTDVLGLTDGVVAIAAGGAHACALGIDGEVSCWGGNANGQLGNSNLLDQYTPTEVAGLGGEATALSAGDHSTCAVISTGEARCWGGNQFGQLGDGTAINRSFPASVIGLLGRAKEIAVGYNHACALVATGNYQCWGSNTVGQVGNLESGQSFLPVDVVGLESGVNATSANCALTSDGDVKCWGYNLYGQLGDGSTNDSLTPVYVVGLGDVVAIASSGAHNCALLNDGNVSCWGFNHSSQLGDGGSVDSAIPVSVSNLSHAKQLALGALYSCALLNNGTIKCWGNNSFGTIGNGDLDENTQTPVIVQGVNNATAIAAGKWHACAVVNNGGGVECWGLNTFGQLGDGTTTKQIVPTPVDIVALGDVGIKAIAAGYNHTCALVKSGVKCWGLGSSGQLGNGSGTSNLTPVAVSGLAGKVTAIAAGLNHSCALLSSGTVQCWGANAFGQLGNGDSINSTLPVTVVGLGGNVLSIAASGNHTCAVLTTGALKCWGANNKGELGSGYATIQLTAAVVAGIINIDDDIYKNGFD